MNEAIPLLILVLAISIFFLLLIVYLEINTIRNMKDLLEIDRLQQESIECIVERLEDTRKQLDIVERELIHHMAQQEHKEKSDIIKRLLKSFMDRDEYSKDIYIHANDEKWTLADLIIRQYLNNNCDGFGMVDVASTYDWLCTIKDDLIKYNLVSKNGVNNFSFPLWSNYNF